MKKKLLILSASISLLMACFPVVVSADEIPQSPAGTSSPDSYYLLDSYFYDNYVSYPYIESSGAQYIDTGIKGKDNLMIEIRFSDFSNPNSQNTHIFGSRIGYQNDGIGAYVNSSNDGSVIYFEDSTYFYGHSLSDPYLMYDLKFDNNVVYLNYEDIHTFTSSDWANNLNIYVFACNNNGTAAFNSTYKLYSFSIYDYDQEEYVRYFYPAKSKSSDTIGLYDAVSKTFYTSLSSTPFSSPSGNIAEAGMIAGIGNVLVNGLGWIGDILVFAAAEPVILLFMAIGLAGAMFRWGRKLVHF